MICPIQDCSKETRTKNSKYCNTHYLRFRKYGSFEKRIRIYKTGYRLSSEHSEKIKISLKGKQKSKEHNNNVSKALKGRKLSKSHILSLSISHKKPKSKNKNIQNSRIRSSKKYKEWRLKVFERDNFTCVICKAKNVYLNADHIKKFADYPRLRLDIDNGRTLCVPCHRKTPNYGNKKA